jgi:LEA14-like dessication related protein
MGKRADALEVTLADLNSVEATAFETRLTVVVRITNLGAEPLAASGASQKLILNNRTMGTAVSDQAFTVPALGTTTQELTLNLSHFALLGLARELQREPVARYRLEGRLHLAGALRRSVPFTSEGVLRLDDLAAGGAGAVSPGASLSVPGAPGAAAADGSGR